MGGVAIVTGGSRGIGAATARLLAEQGFDVAVGYREDSAAAEEVVGACQEAGRRALAIAADVAVEADVVRLFQTVDSELGPLRALVNNAGIVASTARVDELSAARLERLFAVNAVGTILCAREAVRRMSLRHGGQGGSIVNVSSGASRLGSPGEYVDYAATKGAVDSMTIGLAKEVAEEAVRVNAVRPGVVSTEIHASGPQPDRAQRFAHLIPMQRPGEPHEIASASPGCARRKPPTSPVPCSTSAAVASARAAAAFAEVRVTVPRLLDHGLVE
ncbi:MAG: SDR family NAD(P)-dependent oxidoreductase [Acidimicrobiales bacterium]